MDYHRNTFRTLAARLFRSEYQSKVPANRQLDPCSDRNSRYPHHIKPSEGYLNRLDNDGWIEPVEAYQSFNWLIHKTIICPAN